MAENYTVCKCKKVSYFTIVDTIEKLGKFDDVLKAFDEVQKTTHCSTGCGGCHDKVLKIISDSMYGYETKPFPDCKA